MCDLKDSMNYKEQTWECTTCSDPKLNEDPERSSCVLITSESFCVKPRHCPFSGARINNEWVLIKEEVKDATTKQEEIMPRTWIDMGCSGLLTAEAGRGNQRVRALFMNKGQDLFIYSIGEGDHQMNSRHYGCPISNSDAWDQGINEHVSVEEIRGAVGPKFDVVRYEDKGIDHIEYDPK